MAGRRATDGGADVFTGLVEETGTVERAEPEDGGRRLVITAPVVGQGLAIGDSVSVNGCCQTVVATRAPPTSLGNGRGTWRATSHAMRHANPTAVATTGAAGDTDHARRRAHR